VWVAAKQQAAATRIIIAVIIFLIIVGSPSVRRWFSFPLGFGFVFSLHKNRSSRRCCGRTRLGGENGAEMAF